MEISITSFSDTKPVYFNIHIAIEGHTSYILRKRYSDFVAFAEEIEREMGEKTPVPLPEKKWIGNTNAEFLKERRRRLELFLRNLIKQEEWRESLALQKFLETSKHMRRDSRSRNNLESASEWARAVSEVRTMVQQIREANSSADERKFQVKAKAKLQELEGSLFGDNSLGEGEYMRRRNIVQDLSRALNRAEETRANNLGMSSPYINGDSIGESKVRLNDRFFYSDVFLFCFIYSLSINTYFRMGTNRTTIQLSSCLETEKVGVVESWDQEVKLRRLDSSIIVD